MTTKPGEHQTDNQQSNPNQWTKRDLTDEVPFAGNQVTDPAHMALAGIPSEIQSLGIDEIEHRFNYHADGQERIGMAHANEWQLLQAVTQSDGGFPEGYQPNLRDHLLAVTTANPTVLDFHTTAESWINGLSDEETKKNYRAAESEIEQLLYSSQIAKLVQGGAATSTNKTKQSQPRQTKHEKAQTSEHVHDDSRHDKNERHDKQKQPPQPTTPKSETQSPKYSRVSKSRQERKFIYGVMTGDYYGAQNDGGEGGYARTDRIIPFDQEMEFIDKVKSGEIGEKQQRRFIKEAIPDTLSVMLNSMGESERQQYANPEACKEKCLEDMARCLENPRDTLFDDRPILRHFDILQKHLARDALDTLWFDKHPASFFQRFKSFITRRPLHAPTKEAISWLLNQYETTMDFKSAPHPLDSKQMQRLRKNSTSFRNANGKEISSLDLAAYDCLDRFLYGHQHRYADVIDNIYDKCRNAEAFSAKNESVTTIQEIDPKQAELIISKTHSHAQHDGQYLSKPPVLKDVLMKHEPKYSVALDEKTKVYLSDAYLIDQARPGVLAYVDNGDEIVARVYYRSGSQAAWRYLPGYTAHDNAPDGGARWYDKSAFGEDALTLPAKLQKALCEISNSGIKGPVDSKNETFMITADQIEQSTTIHKNHDLYKETNQPVQLADEIDYYGDGADYPDPETLILSTEQSPNFDNTIDSWNFNSPIYGDVKVETYQSKDGQLLFTFFTDSKNRSWISNIETTQHDYGTTGLHRNPISPGALSSPLYEYDTYDANQVGIWGNDMDRRDSYVSIWGFIGRIPVIQDYQRARNIQGPPVGRDPRNRATDTAA